MLEWKHTEGSLLEQEGASATARHVPARGRTAAVLLFIALCVGAGVLAGIWWQARLLEERAAVELLAVVRREEQARRFGLEAEAADFVAQSVPSAWRNRYIGTFAAPAGEPVPVEVSLASFELIGNEAIVQVLSGRQLQERRYTHSEHGWQRAPLGVPPEESAVSRTAAGLLLRYYPQDEAFATETIRALPELLQMWREWGGELPAITEVVIARHEFMRPGYVETATLTIASPLVLSLPAHWDMSGEEAARFWIARESGAHIELRGLNPHFLPGSDRFVQALRTVVSLRFALPAERLDSLAERWAEKASTASGSSFYQRPNHSRTIDPYAPNTEEAAALLIADRLYAQGGVELAATVVRAMRGARGWDEVFSTTTGLATVELETLARGGPVPPALLERRSIRGAPLYPAANAPADAFQIAVEGYGQPVWVQMDDETRVFLPGGAEIGKECAAGFPELTVDGEWVESGLRLKARTVTAEGIGRVEAERAFPAPRDTLFYTVGVSDEGRVTQLRAVREEGGVQVVWERPVLDFNPTLQGLAQLATPARGFTATGTMNWECQATWVVRYESERGVTGSWLIESEEPISRPVYLWDELRGKGIAAAPTFGGGAGGHQYWRLNPASGPYPAVEGRLPEGEPWLLRPGRDQVLLYNYRAHALHLHDLGSGITSWRVVLEHELNLGSVAFAPDGRYLYVLAAEREEAPDDNFPERAVITRHDLESGEERVIWYAEQGGVAMAAADAGGERLYALVKRAEDDHSSALVWNEHEGWQPLLAADAEQPLYFLRPCGRGGALFLRGESPDVEGMLPPPPTLFLVSSEGNVVPYPAALSDGEFPLSC